MTPELLQKPDFIDIPLGRPSGLAGGGERLWISDVASAQICEVHASRGEILRTFPSVVDRPSLLCADEDNLWQYDEETMALFRVTLNDGKTYPLGGAGGGINSPFYGIASDGSHLWVLTPDWPYFPIKNSVVHKLELPWKLQQASFDAPSYGCRGLFFDGKYLWTLDDAKSEVYMFDPEKGTVINIFEMPDLPLHGVVKTEDSLWSIDYQRNRLCRIRMDQSVRFSLLRPRRSRISMTETYANHGPGTIERWETAFPCPKDYVNQRLLSEIDFSEKPARWLKAAWDPGDGQCAQFILRDLKPGDRRKVTASFEIETYDVRFHVYPDRIGGLEDIPDDIRKVYMIDQMLENSKGTAREVLTKMANLFQLKEKDLKETVEEAVGDEKNPYWIARKLYEHVVEKIEYVLPYWNLPVTRMLEEKKASCTMQARLYAALAQAAGLPSRVVGGYAIWREDSRLGSLNHRIAETYLPGFGWLPVDSTGFMFLPADSGLPASKARPFGSYSNRMFVYELLGDPHSESLAWDILSMNVIQSSGKVEIGAGILVDWDSF